MRSSQHAPVLLNRAGSLNALVDLYARFVASPTFAAWFHLRRRHLPPDLLLAAHIHQDTSVSSPDVTRSGALAEGDSSANGSLHSKGSGALAPASSQASRQASAGAGSGSSGGGAGGMDEVELIGEFFAKETELRAALDAVQVRGLVAPPLHIWW